MRPFNNLFQNAGLINDSAKHTRQYRLIRYITCELIVMCTIFIVLYSFSMLWYLAPVIGAGGILAVINLWLLMRTRNTNFCGHLITVIVFITILIASYTVRGLGISYSHWLYVMPVLAASLVGWSGFLIYSAISLLMIIGVGFFSIQPFYHLSPQQMDFIEWTNHLFSYLFIFTTLISLKFESELYEQTLQDKNYLLQLEKDKYQYLSLFDHLTSLPNRIFFKQNLQELMDSRAVDCCITVFFMDLDNFKYVNDYYGHDEGDHLLLQTAKRLQSCFRKDDFLARLGGDEFTAIVLHSPDEKITEEIAMRIIQEFDRPFMLGSTEFCCSISVGLATCPYDSQTISDLMRKADQAMYLAKKKQGRSYYVVARGSVV